MAIRNKISQSFSVMESYAPFFDWFASNYSTGVIIFRDVFHCVKSDRIQSGVILVRIFPAFSCIQIEYKDTEYLSVFSPNVGKCWKNADQNNSE